MVFMHMCINVYHKMYGWAIAKVFVIYNTVTDEDLRSQNILPSTCFYCYVFAQELPSHTFAIAMSLYQITIKVFTVNKLLRVICIYTYMTR